jgi:hypothetical protein
MEKRGAKLTKKDQLAQEIREMMAYAKSQAEFERLLQDRGFTLRQRGKNWVLNPIARDDETKKLRPHRFSTLGIHADYEDFLDRVEPVIEDERGAGEKEKTGQAEEDRQGPKQTAPERDGREADNEAYVKYVSDTDLKSEPASQQNPEASQERNPHDEALKHEPEPYTEANQDDELSERQREWKAQAEERRVKKKNRDRDDQEREQ